MNRIARIFQRKFQSFSYLHPKLSGPLKLDPKFLQWLLWHPPSMTLLATPMCWISTAINSQSWKKSITCRVSSLKDWVVQLESQLSFTYIKRVGWCYKYKFAVLCFFLLHEAFHFQFARLLKYCHLSHCWVAPEILPVFIKKDATVKTWGAFGIEKASLRKNEISRAKLKNT